MPCDCLFVSLTMLPGLDMILSRGKDACFIGAGKKIVFVKQFYESGRRYSTGVFSIGSLLVLCCIFAESVYKHNMESGVCISWGCMCVCDL